MSGEWRIINKTGNEINNQLKYQNCFFQPRLIRDIQGKNELLNRWGTLLSKSSAEIETETEIDDKFFTKLSSCDDLPSKEMLRGKEEKNGREEEKIIKEEKKKEAVVRMIRMMNDISKEKTTTKKDTPSRDMNNSLLKRERKIVRIGSRPQHFSDSEPDSDDDSLC